MSFGIRLLHRYLLTYIGLVLILMGVVSIAYGIPQESQDQIVKAKTHEEQNQNEASLKLKKKVRLEKARKPLREALQNIADQVGLKLSYSEQIIPLDKKIDIQPGIMTANQALWMVLKGTTLRFGVSPSGQLFFFQRIKENAPVQLAPVSGTVTDAISGEPLPGVNVVLKGTTTGVSTDSQGHYELNVPSMQDTLVFSFIGYETRQVPINGKTEIDVAMQVETVAGEELVVMGYSSQKKKDLTGAVSVADMDNLAKLSENQVTNQLQGQISGVTVISSGQPGESPTVRIRGINTFGNNDPLYVVDGIPTQEIGTLNPNDVESMQVLKDASAASIYGSRASNGVVIITTKKGRDQLEVNFSTNFGWEVPQGGNVWEILSPQEMADLKWMSLENSGVDPTNSTDPLYGSGEQPVLPDYILPGGASEGDPEVDPSNYNFDPNFTDATRLNEFNRIIRANKQGTNWFDEVFSPAATTNNNLSVSGGGESNTYLFSLSYTNQQGTLMQTHLKRYTVRANTQFDITDDIRIGENLSYTLSENPTSSTLNENSAISFTYHTHPIIPVYDIMGNWAGSQGTPISGGQNPVATRKRTANDSNQESRLFGNIFAEIDLLDNLQFRSNVGGEIYFNKNEIFVFPTWEGIPLTTTSSYSNNVDDRQEITWSNTLNYTQSLGSRHNIDMTAGIEVNKQVATSRGGTTQGFFSRDANFVNLSNGSGSQNNYSYETVITLFSYFGRINYDYDGRYLVSATVRRDGSSKFLNNKYGLFPAASLGWNLTNESFFNVEWINNFKLRGSYGTTGNQLNVNPNNSFTLFGGDPTSTFYDLSGTNTSLEQGFSQVRIGNPNAQWETNKNMNIGFDATLFGGKIEATIDYYQKNVEDLLYNPELPGVAGNADQPFVNVGNIENNGIDASLTGRSSLSNEFRISGTLTFTSYNNEIVKIADGIDYFDEDSRRFGTPIVRNAVGQPISSYYGYNIVGFWDDQQEVDAANQEARQTTGNPAATYQTEAGVGRFRYEDVNGDGQITDSDRTYLGDPNPDFSYGLNLGFNYRNFDFSMFFYGVQGNEIWNQIKWTNDFYASFETAKSTTALYNSWTPDNKNAEVAIQENDGTFSTNGVPNSYYVEDGSFLRAKNVQVGYTLPTTVLDKFGLKNLRIYLQGKNLFTITNYSGLDPEIGGNTTSFGIDEGAYPISRQFLLGLNLTF